MKHECVYGVTTEGWEITKTLLSGNIAFPKYVVKGVATIGTMQDYLDGRKGLATHYNYCPYCGRKLVYKKIKEVAMTCDTSF